MDKFAEAKLAADPFKYVVVKQFIEPGALDGVRADFPEVPGPGSHPPAQLRIAGRFKALMDEMLGDDFRHAVERKFDIDLTGRPTMYTVRGFTRARDGKIHPDSETKLITVLLYLNDDHWSNDGGRLRLLRSATDLEDFVEEVEPAGGTLLVFKREDYSWHGHHSFDGPRRAIQLNWVTDQSVVRREQGRHGLGSMIKGLFGGAKKTVDA
ncbi:MAG TPA: 2OG-Fe(II) oxygenase [Lacunisphaera sp.]|nr:2OG-Fe(II) oxygenase [Lacunisphaera sp.]